MATPNQAQLENQLFILDSLLGGITDDLNNGRVPADDLGLYFAETFTFLPDLKQAVFDFEGVSVGGGDGGGGNDPSDAIGVMTAMIINSIENNTSELSGKINQLSNNLVSFVDQGFRALQLNFNNNTSAILQNFNDGIMATANKMDVIYNNQLANMQQLFINNSNRNEILLDQRVNDITNKLNSQTDTIVNEVRALNLTGGGGGSVDVEVNSAWTEAYIVDLLGVLDDFRRAFVNKDMSPDITVNASGGVDSSASTVLEDIIGLLNLDPIALAEFAAKFGEASIDPEWNSLPIRIEMLNDLFTDIMENNVTSYDEMIDRLDAVHGGGGVMDVFLKMLLFVPVVLGGLLSASTPFRNNIETLARTKALDGLLSRAELSELWLRELEPHDWLLEQFERIGLSEELSKKVIQTYTVQLNEAYLREAYLRKEIDFDQYRDGMFKLGFSDNDAILIEKTFFRIPPVPDLIRFAVREAYDETLAEQLQLDSGYDVIKEQFESDLERNGLSPEYGQYYWRSHWNLPSPTQGYEMLHRGEINIDELRRLLKVSDYSPEWIDKLIAIAYSPFTRVDIRRMHKVGVLDENGVFVSYKDIGYDDEKAQKLTDFTIALNTTDTTELNKDLTTAQVLKAFVNGIIDVASKDTLLGNLGYNTAEINVLTRIYELNLQADEQIDVTIDNKRRIIRAVSKAYIEGGLSEQSVGIYLSQVGYTAGQISQEITTLKTERGLLLQTERVQHIQQRFIEFRIDDNTARGLLAREGYTPIEENDALLLWNTQRKERYKNPTKAELKKWFVDGNITFDECSNYLKSLGFDNRLVDLYMEDNLQARRLSQQ